MEFEVQSDPVPAEWLRQFISVASSGILVQDSVAPVGCHYYFDADEETWEVSLFLARTEIVGGPMDGAEIPVAVFLDMNTVMSAFDTVPAIHWQSERISSDDQLGNHVSFEGLSQGRLVWLRVLHQSPEFCGPGRLLHVPQGRVEDVW